MNIEFQSQKKIALGVLAALIAADTVLAGYSILMASPGRSPQQELAAQKAQQKLLKADVKRALAIQEEMPKTKTDCEHFESSLLSTSSGYSAVSTELAEVGQNSGLQISSLGFKAKDLPGRNISEIAVEATVTGDYKGVVRFLNGLQRSKNHYVIDSLTLASDQPGAAGSRALRVALHLRSFFKNTA